MDLEELWRAQRERRKHAEHQAVAAVGAAVAGQRRRAAASVCLMMLPDGRGPQGKKYRPKDSFSWGSHLRRLSYRQFQHRYRLDFASFRRLVELLRPDLELARPNNSRWNGRKAVVPLEVKLAIFLAERRRQNTTTGVGSSCAPGRPTAAHRNHR